MSERETFRTKASGYLAIILLCAFGCGAVGYLSQTGLFYVPAAQLESSFGRMVHGRSWAWGYFHRKLAKPMPRDVYRYRTRLGWWIGCGAGTALGLSVVLRKDRSTPRRGERA
jgi:hypothetical protein